MKLFSQYKILFLISRKNIALQHFNFSYYEKNFYNDCTTQSALRNCVSTREAHLLMIMRSFQRRSVVSLLRKKQHSRVKKVIFRLESSLFSISIRLVRES